MTYTTHHVQKEFQHATEKKVAVLSLLSLLCLTSGDMGVEDKRAGVERKVEVLCVRNI